MFVSIIIPVLNEEKSIKALLQQLQIYREQGHEVIVVDGGSHDKTVSISKPLVDKLLSSKPGRALQMNLGANQSNNEVLWFLHADTLIPNSAIEQIQNDLCKKDWGRFDIKLSGSNFLFRIIEVLINLRSCFFAIATGDQGIFVRRKIFDSIDGYKNIPLMEDVELSKNLKKLSRPVCIHKELITSSRRWEKKGILKTVFLMWRIRFLYWLGVPSSTLARLYR